MRAANRQAVGETQDSLLGMLSQSSHNFLEMSIFLNGLTYL